MVTGYLLVQVLQMQILNMVPHVRNAFERTSPFVVCIPLVPDAEDALGLAQNKGKLIELREGIGREAVDGEGSFLTRSTQAGAGFGLRV